MPSWNHQDREILSLEERLWCAQSILGEVAIAGEWRGRVKKIHADLTALAQEVRDYNDEWEEEP